MTKMKRFIVCAIVLILSSGNMPFSVDSMVGDLAWTQVTEDSIRSVDWAPDGMTLVVGNRDGIVTVDANTYEIEERIDIGRTSGRGYIVSWSPEGNWVVAIDPTSYVYVVSAEANKFEPVFYAGDNLTSVLQWGPNSNQFAIFDSEGHLNIIEVPSGEVLEVIDVQSLVPNLRFNHFAWSSNGQYFAIPSETASAIEFLDANGALVNSVIESSPYNEHMCPLFDAPVQGVIGAMEWSPSSQQLAIGSTRLGLCSLNLDGTISSRGLDEEGATSLAWDPTSSVLAIGNGPTGDCWIRLIDFSFSDLPVIDPIGPDRCSVYDIAWSPDGERIAIATSEGLWIKQLE
ncbi:MAG: WD40 repeat domain-containing protein [Anaerolineae bacterium]|nr:WD40 repeat domain-containing protein [Anaerolineae bacterium]